MCATASATSHGSPSRTFQPVAARISALRPSRLTAIGWTPTRASGPISTGVQAAAVELEAEGVDGGQRAEDDQRGRARTLSNGTHVTHCTRRRDVGEDAERGPALADEHGDVAANAIARKTMPPPSNAPSAVGAHSAPSRPSQPITCARQWIASHGRGGAGRRTRRRTRAARGRGGRRGRRRRACRTAPAMPTAAAASAASVWPLALAQPHAGAEQPGRERAGQRRARALADPAARDRDRQQEREPGEHGEAAEPGEQAAADEVLEVARGRERRARAAGRGAARARGARRGATGAVPRACGRDAGARPWRARMRRSGATARRGRRRASARGAPRSSRATRSSSAAMRSSTMLVSFC